MDPLSITTAVLSITKKCCSTASILHEIRTKFKDAPSILTSICSQTTVISASLSQLQYLILKREDLSAVLDRRPELASALDCSMIGCVMLFSCLDDEVARVTKVAQAPNFNWRGKARIMWNQETLRQMLEDLRSQQAALSTLINLFQTDSVAELNSLLDSNKGTFENTQRRTSTLRKSNPNVKVRKSIYVKEDEAPSEDLYSIAPSSPGEPSSPNQPSEFQFDFNNLVKNSRVYKQALAQQQLESAAGYAIEGDLIDLSDERGPVDERNDDLRDGAFEQLQELIISDDLENSPEDDAHTPVAREAPKLELPDDFSRSLDLRRTPPAAGSESVPAIPPPAQEESEDDDITPNEMLPADEHKQIEPYYKFDSVVFTAAIPDDRAQIESRSGSTPHLDSRSASEASNYSTHQIRNDSRIADSSFAGPSSTRYELESPPPDILRRQISPTPSNFSSSSRQSTVGARPDPRRLTSSLEVDFSNTGTTSSSFSSSGRPTSYAPNVLALGMETSTMPRPSANRRKQSSPSVDMSSRSQISPTPSTAAGSDNPLPSYSYYERPDLNRNPSSMDTDSSFNATSSAQGGQKKTLKTRLWGKSNSGKHCYRCKQPITGSHLNAMGVNFHKVCFKCADCNKRLHDTAFPYKFTRADGTTETVPLCEFDYFQRLDPYCRGCDRPLAASYIAAFNENDLKRVPDSFQCENEACGKVFRAPYKYFAQADGKIYC